MEELLMWAYQFAIVASAIWLFVKLTFGFGDLKEAALLTILAIVTVAALEGARPEVFAALLTAVGLISFRIYKIRLAQALTMAITVVFIGLFLFRFS
ncbi:MAG: hypothetical protein ABH863_02545 [Candidatus Micrarchaeota archaeon]